MSPRRTTAFLGLILAVSLGACKNDEITSYRVAKLPEADSGPASPPPGQAPAAPVSWTLPRGWTEKPLTEMRAGSFSVAGEDGLLADVSIVVLGGDAGGDLANVNRWRGQINLEPLGAGALPRYSERVAPGGRRMLLVDFVTKDPFIDNRYRKRLVAAIYERGGRTWFFKMTGEDGLVESSKPAFLEFLAGLRFHDPPGA